MSDDTPPPPPLSKQASEEATWPGLEDRQALVLRLTRENDRLRAERNEARASIPPPAPAPTKAQVVMGGAAKVVRWAGAGSLLLALAAEVAAILKPELVGPIQTLRKLWESIL